LFEIGGKTMPAKVVFAAAIGYLKDHLVGEIKHRKLGAVLILKQLGYTEAGGITLRDYYVQTEVIDWLQQCPK
jgi:hypothetical protein